MLATLSVVLSLLILCWLHVVSLVVTGCVVMLVVLVYVGIVVGVCGVVGDADYVVGVRGVVSVGVIVRVIV